ncbi:GTP-binding protein TrmE N-terminus domain containing protein [Elaphomyces granulatus]
MLRSSLATRYWGLSRNSSLAWSSCCLCSALLTSGAAVQSRHPAKRLPLLSSWQNSTLRAFNSSPVIQFAGSNDSTIYALSTALGRAAIAIVRISGPACLPIYQALCPGSPLPKPRVAALRTLFHPTQPPSSSTVLDPSALILFFPHPRTVTGEDVLELHLHGGSAIVKAVLAAVANCNRSEQPIRYAEPGEFTRRAFMNNRLDLPQIEALGDILAAETEQQRRLAVRGSSDVLSKRFELWRQELLYARGELEALIDFAEDQHFDESPRELIDSVASQVRVLYRQIDLHIQNASKGELLRSGIKVALLGAPNAGKSSLLNRIVGREAAIVSTEEGTTRDIVDVGVDIGGWYCKMGDMAGLRSGSGNHSLQQGGKPVTIGAVETEGIRRAKARALESDVIIVVLSLEYVEDSKSNDGFCQLFMEPEVVEAVRRCQELGKCIILAINKSDRLPPEQREESGKVPHHLVTQVKTLLPNIPEDQIYTISCREAMDESSPATDPGKVQTLLNGLIANFEKITTPLQDDGVNNNISYWEDAIGVTQRQESNLHKCRQHLADFLTRTQTHAKCQSKPHLLYNNPTETPHNDHDDCSDTDGLENAIDIVTEAEHLRFAADSLAKITGKGDSGDVEDVLGVVFEK